ARLPPQRDRHRWRAAQAPQRLGAPARFAVMTNVVREADGKFVVPPKSPGRPRGATESELIRAHLEPKKTAVLNKLAELASLGEPRAMELYLRYFSPGARPEDEKISVPGLAEAQDMQGKAEAI